MGDLMNPNMQQPVLIQVNTEDSEEEQWSIDLV